MAKETDKEVFSRLKSASTQKYAELSNLKKESKKETVDDEKRDEWKYKSAK